MSIRVVLPKAAQTDIDAAAQWYEREQTGLGRSFLDAVDQALARIGDNPEAFPLIWRDKRRALLRRFPYGIYFRLDNDAAVAVACFHARRNPTMWRARR